LSKRKTSTGNFTPVFELESQILSFLPIFPPLFLPSFGPPSHLSEARAEARLVGKLHGQHVLGSPKDFFVPEENWIEREKG